MGQLNRLQTALSEVLNKNRLREKVLIAPSFSSGHQIAESLVKKGTPYLNLRIKTAFSLAHDIVALDLAAGSVSPLSETSLLILIEDIFDEHKQKKGSYFADIGIKTGIIRALADAIYKLRSCGIRSSDLSPLQFVNEQKGREITGLLRQYEDMLKDRKYADYPEVLLRAIEKLSGNGMQDEKTLYLLVSDMPLSVLEKKFIEILPGEKITLPHDVPEGLIHPESYLAPSCSAQESKPKKDIELMPWLFAPEKAPAAFNDASVQMFHSIGRRNEVREVVRRMLSLPATCDDTELICTSYDDYVPLIYKTALKFGIKMTIEDGIPVAFTRCGRAVLGLISWIASNYEAIKFRQLLSGGCLNVQAIATEDYSPSPALMGRIIRESCIGWERDRYIPVLKQMQAMYASRLTDGEENSGRHEFLKIKEANTGFVIQILNDIFSFIPEADKKGMVSISGLCNGVMKFNNAYGMVSDELDAEARSAIKNLLDETAGLLKRQLTIYDALARIEMTVKAIRVGQAGPDHGCVHVSSYRSGGRSGRSRTFILGCDANLFPGVPAQNPVLLDKEMQSVSSSLVPSSGILKENLYRMAALLSSLRGSVTFSFSAFDVLEGRESFPSSLLLQVHRLMTGDITSDYTELINRLGVPSGYVPSSTLIDSIDYWIERFSGPHGLKKACDATIGNYPGLLNGIKASLARGSDILTEYDGRIAPDKELDPRKNKDIILSASMIERFAKCPFSYFLAYVLNVRPLEEIKVERGEWLDALQRGSLLHDLFYRFMAGISARNERPSLRKHRRLIDELADEVINEYRRNIPPPGEAVFEQERKRILKTAEIFLRLEEVHCRECEPVLLEVPFGYIDKAAPAGVSEPVEIDLGDNKKIRVRGRIDRIDRVGKHEYVVWDYKTGSTYGYKDDEFFSGGKVIQHALYAIASEVILKQATKEKDPSVKQSGYFFPTEKGTGRRFLKTRDDLKLKELLVAVFDIMRSGVFIPSDDKNSCAYCDYKAVCAPDVLESTKRKFANDQNRELAKVSSLKKYA